MSLRDEIEAKLRALPDEQLEKIRAALKAKSDYESWLQMHYPAAVRFPFAARHHRLWSWFEALTPGVKPRPRIEVWPRGGAKSSSGQLGVVYLASRRTRKFALIVSGTQAQANSQVSNIASKMEYAGMKQACNEQGRPKAWRRQQLQAESITVAAYGLDTSMRGIMIEDYRPDFVICDDIDAIGDSLDVTEKKMLALTNSVLPTGSDDCAVLFLQNLITENSVFSQLKDGRVDFMVNAEYSEEPAVHGLETEIQWEPTFGRYVQKIVAGEATWKGQSLYTCQQQIYEWGYSAFMREAQHQVRQGGGKFFNVDFVTARKNEDGTPKYILKEMPKDEQGAPIQTRDALIFDLAATEGGGDYFARMHMSMDEQKNIYIQVARRDQWGSEKVRRGVHSESIAFTDATRGRLVKGVILLPQETNQAGKAQRDQFEALLAGLNVRFMWRTGKKWVNAQGFADQYNTGNVYFLAEREGEAKWHDALNSVLRNYKEGVRNQDDDWIDTAADGFNNLFIGVPSQSVGGIVQNPAYKTVLEVTRVTSVAKPYFEPPPVPEEDLSDDEWMKQFGDMPLAPIL